MAFASCNAGGLPPADDLVAFPWGLERNAARHLIATGELRARKIGRKWYARRSDVLRLIDAAPSPPKRAPGGSLDEDLDAIARGGR